MKINDLLKDQAKQTLAVQKYYLDVVEKNIKKYGVVEARPHILIELRKKLPIYIFEGLKLGTQWLRKESK